MSSALGDPWDDIPVGHLCDVHLKKVRDHVAARDAGAVVIETSHVLLHVGEVVWHRSGGDAPRREPLDICGETEVQPGEVVTIVTDERLTLPAFVSGKIFPKGRTLPMGLVCTSTTIDAGYDNYLRVTIINVGGARVRLPRGLGVAKVELVRLPSSVERPYVSHEDPKTNLPRDDYLFAGAPLVEEAFRLKTLLEMHRNCEERLMRMEACIARTALRQRRVLATLTLIGLLATAAVLPGLLGRLVTNISELQARSLWTNVVGGMVLLAAAGLVSIAKGPFWDWVRGIPRSSTPVGATIARDQDGEPHLPQPPPR